MGIGIFDAYASGSAGAFFEGHFASAADRARARGVVRPLAPTLADALDIQNRRFARSSRREVHLEELRRGAAVVVTGQQVGLFLGPLYAIYKAATTIRLAAALRAEWGLPVVPVFWLQTEDHDLAEISVCRVPSSRGDPLTLVLPAANDRVSIAHRRLPDEVTGCLKTLEHELARFPHAAPHLDRLTRHYRPEASWSDAFGNVLAEIFSDEGIVLLDPRDPALARLAAPVHRRAIVDARPIGRALGERVTALTAAGFSATVQVRADSPLSFFHPTAPDGPRFRLERSNGGYAEIGGDRVHSEAALLDALETDPARFSTSALLRPILQDTWLPTAAYVGGPAEVAYFAQLAPVYAGFGVSMPLIVPRAQFRLVEKETGEILARLGLRAGDVGASTDPMLAAAIDGRDGEPDGETLSRELSERFDEALREIVPTLRKAEGKIDRAIAKTRGTVGRAVGKLGRNYDKARMHRDDAVVRDVRRLQGRLYPNGRPQERVFGISYFAARHGERALLEKVLGAAAPLETGFKDLEL